MTENLMECGHPWNRLDEYCIDCLAEHDAEVRRVAIKEVVRWLENQGYINAADFVESK